MEGKDHIASRDHAPSSGGAVPSPGAEHTPGPWVVQPYSEDGEPFGLSVIAVIPGQDTPTRGQVVFVTTEIGAAFDDVAIAKANAALIAAGPDLLAAAKRALNVLKAQGESVRPGNALGALQAAIANATGP